jgi:hypothetical protein
LYAVPPMVRPQYATGVMTAAATVRIGNQSVYAMVHAAASCSRGIEV